MNSGKIPIGFELESTTFDALVDVAEEKNIELGAALDLVVKEWDYYRTNEAWEDEPTVTPLDALAGKIEEVDRLVEKVIAKLRVTHQQG